MSKSKLEHEKFQVQIRIILFVVFIILFNFIVAKDLSLILIILVDLFLSFNLFVNFRSIKQINKKIKKIKEESEKRYKESGNPFNYYGDDDRLNSLFEELWKHIQEEQKRKQQTITVSSEKLENAYKLLKISKNDSIERIKEVYRELAKKWHPDKWITDSTENQKIAERNFKKLQAAYDLIKKDKNIC